MKIIVFCYTPHGKIISCVRSGDLGDHTTEPGQLIHIGKSSTGTVHI